MELYIVRHGTTDWNAQKRFQGAQDIDLNEKGRVLAAELGKRLDSEGLDFDCIYSSPLSRAYETACLIRGHKTYPIIKNQLLTETEEKIVQIIMEEINADLALGKVSSIYFTDYLFLE